MSTVSPRRLSLLSALVLVACVVFARPAAAQLGTAGTDGTTTTASLADGDIFIGVQATQGANLAAFDLARFFNKAACDCDTPVFLYFTLTATGFSKRTFVQTGERLVLDRLAMQRPDPPEDELPVPHERAIRSRRSCSSGARRS